jgi:riboflavin kinase
MDELFIKISEMAGLYGSCTTSTTRLASELKMSQQSASRKLIWLEKTKMIKRQSSPKGVIISLEDKGREALKLYKAKIDSIMKAPASISGIVQSGLGEGKYYMKIYRPKLEKRLDFNPYEGTLNLKVDEKKAKEFLSSLVADYVPEFSDGKRTYGAVNLYKVKVANKVSGAILVPVRSTHANDTLEVVAPKYLRASLKLRDGSRLRIER